MTWICLNWEGSSTQWQFFEKKENLEASTRDCRMINMSGQQCRVHLHVCSIALAGDLVQVFFSGEWGVGALQCFLALNTEAKKQKIWKSKNSLNKSPSKTYIWFRHCWWCHKVGHAHEDINCSAWLKLIWQRNEIWFNTIFFDNLVVAHFLGHPVLWAPTVLAGALDPSLISITRLDR